MLVTYMVTNVGALRFLLLGRRVRPWEAIVPVVALAILVYVIYANVYPVPDFPFNIFPYIVATWLVLGLGIVPLVPGLARRIGANLAEREGLAIDESTLGAPSSGGSDLAFSPRGPSRRSWLCLRQLSMPQPTHSYVSDVLPKAVFIVKEPGASRIRGG